ncbi:MAG: methyltransferase domain-containing protein [Planctomycetes bacterium]|nr:methyltransferase domain-containing protein [Planctomycetota bacterium]
MTGARRDPPPDDPARQDPAGYGPSSYDPSWYDRYWRERAGPQREARARARARIAASLLDAGGARILDVGCGPGWAADELVRCGFEVAGADGSPEAVAAARGRGIDARVLDIETAPVPRGYDAIVCLEVLEHLADPRAALARILEAAGGMGAVISLPNEFHVLRRLRILAGSPGFGGHDDPHIHHFGWPSARRLVAQAGGEIVAWRPASIVPPGLGLIARAGDMAARSAPSLLAISFVFRLRRAGP